MPTMFDKIWQAHVVAQEPGRPDLLYVDRHLIHEVTSAQAFESLRRAGRKVRRTDLTYAVMDHVTPTTAADRVRPLADEIAENQLAALERNCAETGVTLFDMDHPNNGVIHVTMPEQGLVLPGQTVVAGDGHTCTHGAFGALAFGIGTSEVEHVLATQCLPQNKLKTLAVNAKGLLAAGLSAKDLILAIIGRLGAGGGAGFAIEFRGEAVRALDMEGRMTLCNMSVECGAKSGMVAPDETTYAFLKDRPYAPKGENFERALAYWRTLPSDADAAFDRELDLDAAKLAPQSTWGTSPDQETDLMGEVPSLDAFEDADKRSGAEKALEYMDLKPGTPLRDVAVDYVFVGSCTNGRLGDLRAAAEMVKGKKIASGVRAMAVPGSAQVQAQAEAEGLDRIFSEAGFEWRLPGCSYCLAMNPDAVPEGKRCASTSNRNFQGRQGRGSRTHLVSPASAAASAITGRLTDPRQFLGG